METGVFRGDKEEKSIMESTFKFEQYQGKKLIRKEREGLRTNELKKR